VLLPIIPPPDPLVVVWEVEGRQSRPLNVLVER
jgi:hypothetical protein